MKLLKEYEERIRNYVAGPCSPKLEEEVREMFIDGENNYTLRSLLENDWYSILRSDTQQERDLNPLLDRIHHKISLRENRRVRRLVSRLSGMYTKIAAALLLPILIGGSLLLLRAKILPTPECSEASIYAPVGSRVAFSLPDGTNGMLNSGSTLTYSNPFVEKREVTLTGEAWFEVKRNTKLPFKVFSGEMKLTVIGTSFNVSAYPEEKYVEVVLEKGSLLVNCGLYDEGIVMKPSERLVFKDGVVSRSIEETEKYSSWTKGRLVFRSDSMVEVARRIERWYNVKLELMDSELERYSFRATFEDDPLEEVLKYLSMTSPIRYEIIPGMVDENSTFTKKTVKISLQ